MQVTVVQKPLAVVTFFHVAGFDWRKHVGDNVKMAGNIFVNCGVTFWKSRDGDDSDRGKLGKELDR